MKKTKVTKKSHFGGFRGLNSVLEQVKASRKQSREEEITAHGKAINYRKVMASKMQFNRKKNKADDEVLPYFFYKGPAVGCCG
ncbi:MAG: hypothetical protein GZ091_02470 [Paludibacter sp.]|nr:hypothetical protein [Paludibacter sp.]